MLEVQEFLNEFREKWSVDRVGIFQFHNGGKFFHGIPMKKYSQTFESVSHGVSKFLNESLMDRSDGMTALFNPETGLLDVRKDTNVEKLNIPYSLGVFTKEIEAMHISMKFIS